MKRVAHMEDLAGALYLTVCDHTSVKDGRGAGIRAQRPALAASYGDAPSRASELMRAPARLAGLMRTRRAHVDPLLTRMDPKWIPIHPLRTHMDLYGPEERPVWAHWCP